VSEEDLFIKSLASSSMLSLPNELRRHVVESGHNPFEQTDLACLPNVIEDKACRLAGLLSELLEGEADP
jgi:hypothetical protein